jgi:hypothetical protein
LTFFFSNSNFSSRWSSIGAAQGKRKENRREERNGNEERKAREGKVLADSDDDFDFDLDFSRSLKEKEAKPKEKEKEKAKASGGRRLFKKSEVKEIRDSESEDSFEALGRSTRTYSEDDFVSSPPSFCS